MKKSTIVHHSLLLTASLLMYVALNFFLVLLFSPIQILFEIVKNSIKRPYVRLFQLKKSLFIFSHILTSVRFNHLGTPGYILDLIEKEVSLLRLEPRPSAQYVDILDHQGSDSFKSNVLSVGIKPILLCIEGDVMYCTCIGIRGRATICQVRLIMMHI